MADISSGSHVVVCGDNPLAYRLVDELVNRHHADVIVILADLRANHGPQIAELPVRVIESPLLDALTFQQADLAQASALALVDQDDAANIHAALQAQEINSNVRLVIRMFNMNLGHSIQRLFADCAVLSAASMAAPAFVAAALGEVVPLHLRLPGRTVHVARREDVRPADVVCGLARTADVASPELLPENQDGADLVLAVADGAREPKTVGPRRPSRLRRWLHRRRRYPFGVLTSLISRKLRIAAVVLVGLLALSTVVLAINLDTSLLGALYVTIIDALGGASANMSATPVQKVIEALLTLISIALIPVITAAVVEVVVNARLNLAQGRLKEPISDHVIVVGLGNVGTRVIRQLHDLGVPVVAIDRSESARGVQLARELDIPVIIGDATQGVTLRAASVQTSRAVLALSSDDIVNLEVGLYARDVSAELRVVLRLFDAVFADRVQRAFGISASRSVSYLAAPAFADALMERQVIGTIPVNRRILLVAQVAVDAGSELDGAALSTVHDAGQARVIGLSVDRRGTNLYSPAPQHILAPQDVLIVVATRAGLGRLLERTAAAPVHPVPQDARDR